MRLFAGICVYLSFITLAAQPVLRKTWHDKERQFVKEIFQVKDTVRNIRNGRYTSYYVNGKVESRGYFENNQTTGIWEFFYESGNLKMRGVLKNGTNSGNWEFFYENGQKSMEGVMNGRTREGKWNYYYENGSLKETGTYVAGKRQGIWKAFYEDGTLKSEGEYNDDYGLITEYYHSGKVYGSGPKAGTRKVGRWRYFSEADGTLSSEGDYADGRKNGLWTGYYPSGKVASQGNYIQGEPHGQWNYYYENGQLSSAGVFSEGKRDGYWVSFSTEGKKISECNLSNGTGQYQEYYPSGKLKITGNIVDELREGEWIFYREDGTREGVCQYERGKGRYSGFYPNGALHTRGEMEGDKKVGTWEIYDPYGKLTGYYRPYYDEQNLAEQIVQLSKENTRTSAKVRRGFSYFTERTNEFKGIILGGNPMLVFAGRLPMAVEFYNQERLGHEFEFTGIRDPFFVADHNIATDKPFRRGYSMAVRQKFYNPVRAGMWYFAHEIRFTNLGHFVNEEIAPDNVITLSASEQRVQYGLLAGYRIMQRNNRKGFTLDLFVGCDIGYRNFDVSGVSQPYFVSVNQSPVAATFQGGLHIGHVFSAR
jgi:antitoxin component YwqK of YwqJK toxin-antitoxin module